MAEIDVSFDFEDQLNPYINEVKLYAIMEDENSVVVYNPIDWDKLKVVPGSKTKLVAILPNGNVAFVPVSSFLAKVKKYTGKVYFETKQMNADDFFAKELPAINKDVI